MADTNRATAAKTPRTEKTCTCASPQLVLKGQPRVPAPNKPTAKAKSVGKVDALPVDEDYSQETIAVLGQIHPGFSLDRDSLESINCMMNDIFHRIATEAGELAARSGKKTLGTREIRSAVRLVLCGELTTHALSEGDKAIDKYEQSLRQDQDAASK